MPDKPFLSKVYDLKGDGVRDYYDHWAETYEAEITANAYATPARCAEALSATGLAKTAPILDFACGTGLSGEALQAEGFRVMDGVDLSDAMLTKARAKNIYRTLTKVQADAPPPVAPNTYQAITAIGAIGPGAAPAEAIAPLVAALPSGGYFVISLNDVALDTPKFPAALDAQAHLMALISEQRGAHLPGIDVMSTVYVFRRT